MVAPMSVTQQQQNGVEQQQQSTTTEQLYYAQLLAAQQQAISAHSSSSNANPSNGSNSLLELENAKDGAKQEQNGKESERERREREWSERNTNLIVNYVPQTMTQEEVRALFGAIGEVESCKLIRDKATGQSLGYAFVNYEQAEHAQKALTSMNGLRIQNKTLKVSLARPSKDDIKGANLYVSGLPKSLTQPELEAIFRPLGSIINSRILYDNVTGLSKGVGFVRFDCKAEAEEAIHKMSGSFPWGGEEPITVKFANSPSSNSAKSTAIQMAQSLLPLQQILQQQQQPAPVAPQLSLPSLLSALPAASAPHSQQSSIAGGPIHAHIPQHRFRYSPLAGAPLISSVPMLPTASGTTSMASLGLANAAQLQNSQPQQDYLTILQQQLLQQQLTAAAYAGAASNPLVATSNAHNLATQQYTVYMAALGALSMNASPMAAYGMPQTNGNTVVDQHQQSNNKSPPGAYWTLAISNLDADVEESTLWKLFGPFGAVLAVRLAGKTGGAKGGGGGGLSGQVTMANYEEALAAMAGLNGRQLDGRVLQVSFCQTTAATLPSLLR